MAEEQEQQSGGTSIKQILIGLVSTITLGVGGWFTTKLTGGDDDKGTATQTAQPVININNTQQQSQAAGGKTVIIKEKAAEPAKPTAPVKKKEGDEFKEKPAQW
jgi:hypothetical protein